MTKTALTLAALLLPATAIAQTPASPPPPPPAAGAETPLPVPPLGVAQPVPAPVSPILLPPALPPPVEEKIPQSPGVTKKGLPLAQRGGVFAELAGMADAQTKVGSRTVPSKYGAIDLIARVPVADGTFIDADLPIGFGTLGNPMVGAHHVFRPADRFWINLGGAFGFPLINTPNDYDNFAFANALWDAQRFRYANVPFAFRFGLEGHASIVEIRAELDPVWGVSHKDDQAHYFAFQHALEIQLGHEIGGGLRYQGVVIATETSEFIGIDNTPFGGTDDRHRYQPVLEPFFRLYKDPIFLRLGFMMPLGGPLGLPFASSWGIRAATGFNLD
jgi:hypothetical protein